MINVDNDNKNSISIPRWFYIIIIFLCIFAPIATNFIANTPAPSFWPASDNSAWLGFFATFYGAVFGGILSGLFTFLGVKKTILIQNKSEDKQRQLNKLLLFNQLKYTYDFISKINPDDINLILVSNIVYDNNWTTQITYFNELTEIEINTITKWFVSLNNVQNIANSQANGGFIEGSLIYQIFEKDINEIGSIIDKMAKILDIKRAASK